MANAKKCDRCGTLYEKYDGLEVVLGGCKYNSVTISRDYGSASSRDDYDLCPECMKSLIKWMKEDKNNET